MNVRTFLSAIAAIGATEEAVEESPSEQTTIFDPISNVVQQTLENHGMKVGTLVAPKKVDPKHPKADEQLEIGHVNDDGTVGMHPVGADGSINKAVIVMTDSVKLQNTFKTVDSASRLSKWDALSNVPPTPGQDFWLSVGTQATAATSYQRRNCPAGSIYIQKKPVVKVVVVFVPTDDFVFTPYPAILKKGRRLVIFI